MKELLIKQRWIPWASLIACAGVWVWLLALLPIHTAAMGKAAPLLAWLRAVWASSEDMGHGPFLPLVSGYVIFLRRRAILESIRGPDGRGLAALAAGALIFWLGLKTEDVRIFLLAMTLWVWAAPFAVWGAGAARQLVFPAAYLLLCIPIDSLVIFFTMKLRLLAAAAAVALANGVGISTTRVGTGLYSAAGAGFSLDVAEPCSGLRSIFAMTALAAAYAFFTQKRLWRQWALFACAVPVAVLGNIARIVAIVLVASLFGEQAATGFYHDYSGYIVFLVALLLLMEAGRLLGRWEWPERIWARLGIGAQGTARPTQAKSAGGRAASPFAAVVVPLVLLGCGLMALFEPPVQPGSLAFLPDALPREVGAWSGSPVWHCHHEQCLGTFTERQLKKEGIEPLDAVAAKPVPAEAWPALADLQPRYRCPACGIGSLYEASLGEQRQLPGDTRLLRSRYERAGRGALTVTLVVSGASRSGLHRPELCLPAQGLVMTRIRTAEAGPGGGGGFTVKAVDLERKESRSGAVFRMAFLYWFFNEDRQTASHLVRLFWTAWDRAFHRRAGRWAMVTVAADRPMADDRGTAELLSFAGELKPALRP